MQFSSFSSLFLSRGASDVLCKTLSSWLLWSGKNVNFTSSVFISESCSFHFCVNQKRRRANGRTRAMPYEARERQSEEISHSTVLLTFDAAVRIRFWLFSQKKKNRWTGYQREKKRIVFFQSLWNNWIWKSTISPLGTGLYFCLFVCLFMINCHDIYIRFIAKCNYYFWFIALWSGFTLRTIIHRSKRAKNVGRVVRALENIFIQGWEKYKLNL